MQPWSDVRARERQRRVAVTQEILMEALGEVRPSVSEPERDKYSKMLVLVGALCGGRKEDDGGRGQIEWRGGGGGGWGGRGLLGRKGGGGWGGREGADGEEGRGGWGGRKGEGKWGGREGVDGEGGIGCVGRVRMGRKGKGKEGVDREGKLGK